MAQENSSLLIANVGDEMSIQQDAQDYYYNVTNGYSCWGGGETTPAGYYEPSNYYMTNNAKLIYYDLQNKGWTFNPIMAVLGNMSYESSLNPAQYEIGKAMDGTNGYGLAQWTPSTNITDYLTNHGHAITSGYYQLDYLDSGTGWIAKSDYNNMSWSQFKTSTESVDYLTNAFRACYERGRASSYRNYCANYYANYFGGGTTGNQIYVTSEGNGIAYASPSSVEYGDDFTLYAQPSGAEQIVSITGTTQSGTAIATVVAPSHVYNYDSSYGAYINFHVVFTGTTPPIPPAHKTKEHKMPIWMYPCLRC